MNISPTLKILSDGSKIWSLPDGKYHREDGPAIECSNGTKLWYLNNKLHREDGPAVEYADGTKFWYINDYRIDDPNKCQHDCCNKQQLYAS